MPKERINIFIAYAEPDAATASQLEQHLRSIRSAANVNVSAVNTSAHAIITLKEPFDIILLLISETILRVHYKYIAQAIDIYQKGNALVIPILAGESNWQDQPFADLEILPAEKKPLSSFIDKEPVLTAIVQRISEIIDQVLYKKQPNVKLASEVIAKEKSQKTGRLDISNYGLRELPAEILDMDWLEELVTGDAKAIKADNPFRKPNMIADLPDGIAKLGKLKSLVMSNSGVYYTANIGTLKKLESLDLSNNKLSAVEHLGSMDLLTLLNVSKNQITDISGLKHLKSLKYLDISYNHITAIPVLAGFGNIENLNASHNQIGNISSLKNLRNPAYLWLNNNKIKDITPLKNLKKLTSARLDENQIEDLSPLFGLIEQGLTFVNHTGPLEKEIKVGGNPLKVPNISYIESGRDGQLAFIKSRLQNLELSKSSILKVILLGNSNSGKTTLRKFLAGDPHYKHPTTTTTKLEIEKIPWKIKWKPAGRNETLEDTIELRVLDFGGQEYFHGTYPLFFSLETLYVVMWADDENKYALEESRDEAMDDKNNRLLNEDFDVAYWLNSIQIFTENRDSTVTRQQPPVADAAMPGDGQQEKDPATVVAGKVPEATQLTKDIPVLVIQNKVDLHGFVYEDMKTFSETFDRFNIDTLSVSLTGEQRLGILKDVLHQKIIETNAHQRQVPTKWKEVLGLLRKKHQKDKIIYYKDFTAVARKCFPNAHTYTDQYLKGIADYFHTTHEFIYFRNISEGVIVLDTNWFINAIYELISANTSIARKGRITESYLHEVTGKACSKPTAFIEILKANNILFPFQQESTQPQEQYFVLPQLLPLPEFGADRMLFESFDTGHVVLVFTFHIHRTTIQSLFGLLKKFADDAVYTLFYYKNGLVVKKAKAMIFIEVIQEKKQIVFNVTKQSQDNDDLIKAIIFDILTDKSVKNYALLNRLPLGKNVAELHVCLTEPEGSLISIKTIQNVANDVRTNKKMAGISFKNKVYDLIDFAPYRYLMEDNIRMPQRLFISYSHIDLQVFKLFTAHLSNLKNEGLISLWDDRMIQPGDKWDIKILTELRNADIVIFLISQDFMNSEYIQEKEFRETYKNLKKVIPVLVRSYDYSHSILQDSQFTNTVPLLPSQDPEDSIIKVINEIRKILEAESNTITSTLSS